MATRQISNWTLVQVHSDLGNFCHIKRVRIVLLTHCVQDASSIHSEEACWGSGQSAAASCSPFKFWNSRSSFFLSSTCSNSCFCSSSEVKIRDKQDIWGQEFRLGGHTLLFRRGRRRSWKDCYSSMFLPSVSHRSFLNSGKHTFSVEGVTP